MSKILCIGGSGFIGSRLLEIARAEYDIVNYDKEMSPFHPDITLIGDVRNIDLDDSNFKQIDTIILLAAEHRDDVRPIELYYDVNVNGAKKVIQLAQQNNINKIIFTSSVAVYGNSEEIINESYLENPSNHYGKSKLAAEVLFKEWHQAKPNERCLLLLRPTVVFGERNRGNVIKLFRQIESGKFFFIGNGKNIKSIAYLDNVVHFILFMLKKQTPGCQIINYSDKPDLNTNQLVALICNKLNKKPPRFKIPLFLGVIAGMFYDVLAKITRRNYAISLIRIIKFTVNTQFDTINLQKTGFKAPFTIAEGVEKTIEYERSANC